MTQPHDFRRCYLRQFLRVNGALNAGYQLRFEQVRLGIGKTEVGENIGGTA